MSDYVIYVDSACDLSKSTMDELGIAYSELTFMFDGSTKQYRNYDLSSKEFYDIMRSGMQVKTSAVNSAVFEDGFRKILEQGKDILYLAFSSALSSTINNAAIAATDLEEDFPDRKIHIVDTLSASSGIGYLAFEASKMKEDGATLEEVEERIESLKLKINHWFSVDDIQYLRKGGRIGAAAAKVVSKIRLKPVLNMNDEGELVFKYMARGKKAMYKALLEEYGKRALKGGKLLACHADAIEDIETLAALFKENFGVTFSYIADVGPVIGGHTGPGVISIFFEGAGR